jgi:hypothetical protein
VRQVTQVVLERAEPGDRLALDLERGQAIGDALLGIGYHVLNTLSQLLKGAPLRLAHASEVVVDFARCHTPSVPPLVSRMGYVEEHWDGLFWAAWNSS